MFIETKNLKKQEQIALNRQSLSPTSFYTTYLLNWGLKGEFIFLFLDFLFMGLFHRLCFYW